MTTYSPISYDQIVANIRADADKIVAGRQYLQEAPAPITAPSFDEYARGLGYDGVDYEGKENIKRSWLNQHGQAWRQAGANPEDDLAKYAQTIKPVRSAFDTDWLDLAKQAANRSISGISNVIANELPSGYFKEGFQKQGAEYAGYARENAANFSDVTKDRLAREAREQREVEAAGGGELGAAALAARHVSERPGATVASAIGSSVTQLPGLALQGIGGALAATGVGAVPGAGLITAGRALNTATSAASVAGEVGQGAYDMVMNLPTSKVQGHPEFVRALADAKSFKLSDSEAQIVAHRAVASMAMSEGTKYGLGIGAASGAISGGFGAGKIAEEAGKKVAGAFLKRAGIEFVSEGTEEAVGQVAQNKAANSGGAAIPLQKGTGSAFVEGAAGGLGLAGAGAAVGKTASAVVDKALDIATRPNVKPTTKGELMDKVSTGMPQYLQEAASDLIDTIIANPNPTPEMQSEIDASKAQLISMGMSEADIDGLFAENVAPDPLVNVPSYTDGPAKDVMVGSYKPAETGGRPGTEAPTRLVTELAKEGELTLEAVNNVAGQHEKSYETWVVQTQSQPSRVPTQEFISGTADNMVVTALNLGLPMDAELRTYAEAKALELAAVQDTDPNNLGSRLMADGETLMSESQYQATQMGTAENLIGEYVLYGNAEGYVVQRPNGLYVVDTRPGNTQDIFIESGLSGQSPASIGIKLMAPPKIKVPTGAKGQTPAQLVAEAQLTYDQIKLNDALDLLVLSLSATEAEAFLEALDQRLATNATPGQVAQEIENEINKVLSRDSTDSGAVSSQDVAAPDVGERYSQPAGGSGLNTSAPSDSAPAAEVEVWTADGAKERITQWLQANGGTGQIRSDVRILDKLPGFVTGELQQGVDAGELKMRGPGGTVVDSVEKMAVFGARRKDASYLFPANTPVNVDPVRVLIHETWHKYQNADTVLRLHELLDRWRQSPVDSIQYKAFLRGEEVITDASDVTGGMNERIPKILDFLWENGVRPDQRTGVARWMDTAIAAVRHVMRHMFGKDLGWTAAELMTFAQKMVLDDSNGKEATQYLGEKTKAARREAETKAAKAISKPRFSTPFDGPEKARTPLDPKARHIIVDGVKRPTYNNEGGQIHASVEGVMNFWRWFGDSKGVDKAGRPRVYRHGTRARNLDEFRQDGKSFVAGAYTKQMPGIYFFMEDNGQAEAYTENETADEVVKAYLKFSSPADFRKWAHARDGFKMDRDEYEYLKNDSDQVYTGLDYASRHLKDAGFDSFYDFEYAASSGPTGFAVLNPNQIKSATGNNGDFNRNTNKINFSTADIAKLSDRGVPLKEFAQQFAGDIKQKDRDVADADKIALDYFDQVIKDPMSVLPLVKGSSLSYKQYLRMPDGLDYDPQNINHITATDLTKSVYAAVKSGRIEAALEGEAKAANESRAQDLRSLARYLRGNQEYRTTEAAVMLKAAAKWGMRLSTNNDQATVELVEITNKNATAIAVLGGLDAAALSEQMRAGKPLKTAFRDALQQTVDARERAAKASGKDGWVVYKKSDKHEDAVALRDGCAGREWCTAGAVSTAAMQLRQGDFHVFYRDGQPVVALRTVNGRLGEAPRGSLKGQGLTDFERGVAERRLRGQPEPIKSKNLPAAPTQPNVTGGEDFLDDQAFLASMQSAVANNFKDYNDHQLFLLQGHQMRAGDYTGGLPASLQTAIEKELYKRKPKATWAVEGYMLADDELFLSDDGGRGTVRQPNPSVKYIVGSVELYGDNSLLNVEVVTGDVVLKGDNDAPKLQVVGGSLSLDGTSTAEAVQQVGGNVVVYSDASLPALRVVGGGLQADPAQWVVGVKTNVGRETALEGTPLDPSYGSAPVAQVQPTVTGGEDFLDDQKVLADIQSGAIKGYSDYALFTLQAYRMKAGDYVGDQLPEAALEKVWDTIQERDPSVKSWQSKGYWNVRDILTKDDLGSVKVLVGDIDDAQRTLVKWGDFSVPELLDLRIAGLAADVDLQLDAPKLLRADELSLKLDSNVPSLQEVGTLEVDTRVQIPNLSVVGPGTLFAIHPPTTTKQSSYPHILSLLPETKFILRDRIPGVKYDLRKIFPSAAMGGEMDFSGFDSQIKEFGDTEAAPPALPKVDVERALAPASTQVQPLVTGGEDFLDDQKVLNDIQSGAIKQYSDARLWMLQGYRLKAGDYSGDKLPLAARETVEAAVRARKSIAKWNKDGYHESLNSTVDSKEVLSAARYVYGRVYASRDVQMPDLVEADSIDAYSSNFPNLEVVHARHGISLVASTAPKLHTGFGTAVVDKTSLPALRNIGSIRIDADKKPLSFDSLENVTSIYAARNGIQNLSFPKLKKVAQEALFAGTILSPLLESVGNKDTNTSSGTTFSAVVKPGSNFESLRWVGLGATMVGRGFTFPSLQVVVGGLHLNDLDASQFPALEAAGKVYADKSKALEAAPLLNRVGYKITGKKGESISATGIETGVKHAGVIKNTILDPEYNANDPRFALKTSVPLISGGEAFLQEQALLDKIKNNDFDGYSDFDLFSLRYHTVEGDGYESTSLSPVAIEAIDKAVLARHSNAEWMALGYYDDLVAGRNWTGQANPKVFVGDTIEITSQEMADKLSTLEIAPRLKFDATITGDISFSKLRKVNSIYIDYTKNGPHKSPSLKFTALEEVVEDIVEPTSFTGELYVPKLRTIGKGLSDLSDAPSNLKSNYPALTYVNAGFVENSVRLPKLTSGFIFPEQVGFDASVSAPLLPEDNINWDFARDSDGNDVDFSVADRLRTAAPRAQPRSLADRLTIIERGELKTKLPVWQDLKDWIVKTMIDGTRPFEAWAREFGTSADQAALNQKKSLARTRVAAYISEIDGAYTRPLAAALSEVVSKTKVKDTIAAKELVGTWMTVRYAQIKNAEFLQQDQAAVDEAEQAFIAAGGNMVGLRAELQAFSTSTPSATRLTLRSERAAKRFAKASDATRAASRAYVTALTKQEDRLKAVSDPNKNLDPVKTPLDAGLAGGYNNATAAEVQRLIEAKIPRALLDKASAPVYAMIQANTQKDLRNGKISLLAYSKWPAQPLYVPLTGDPRTDDTTSDVFGTGSVNQSKDKRAEGRSSSLAQNGIDAAYEQVGKSSQYHGWLPFKQELAKIYERLLTENNNDASTVYEKYGIKRTRETAMTDLSNSVVFRYGANRSTEGGWAYTFDSVAAIEALRHANVEQRPGWLAPIGWATTTAAKLITQFTPGFAVINAFRDGPERFLNLSTRKLANYPGLNMNKVARDAALVWSNPLTIAAARVVLAERLSLPEVVRKVSQSVPDFTPEATKYLREMLGEGASSTTGAYLSRDSGDLAEKLVKINGWPAKTKNMLVVWNDSFELKAPLAMYTALRENGVDKEAAAATVLGTMDFGKAGTAMAPIKALYMFAQPIATGSNELVKTIATTKGKAYAVAMTTAAMGLYAMLSDMAGEDPETKRKRMASISSSTLERSIPVIQPDGTVLKVPVPFGLFQLTWGTGANIMRALNGEQSVAETLGEIPKLGFKTFSPISPSETSVARDPLTWAVQTFTPTELKPIANAALNKGAFGGKLDSREFLDPSQPKWKYAKPGTPETYVEASKWLLRNTGMNMSPEVMRELSRVVAVGPLAEVQKGFIDNPHKDALGIKRQSQWFDRYMTTQTPADVVAPPYYHALDQVTDLKKRVEAGERVGDRDRQLLALAKSDETARKSRSQLWSALRKQENGGTIKPEAYRERYQQLKALELQAQRRFLVNFERLTK